MVREPHRGLRDRIDALDWMAPATKKEAKAKLATLNVGIGLSRQVARLHGPRGRGRRGVRQPERAELFDCRGGLAKLGRSGRPQRVDDDAAERERGQPAGVERDELPRRHPSAALLRPRAPGGDGLRRDRRRDRSRDEPQLRRSGALFDVRGSCTTGGRRRTSQHFKASASGSSASSTRTGPFPTSR